MAVPARPMGCADVAMVLWEPSATTPAGLEPMGGTVKRDASVLLPPGVSLKTVSVRVLGTHHRKYFVKTLK